MEPGWVAPVVRLLVPGGLVVRHRQSGSPHRHNAIPTSGPDDRPMTTNSHRVTVVLDPVFRDVLRVEDLPVRALQLPCAHCGRTAAAHGGRPPDCEGFQRPGLPLGYVYVDQLRVGDAFRFVSRGSDAAVRVAAHQPFALDEETGLLQVQSSMRGMADVVHLVQANTIVRRDAMEA